MRLIESGSFPMADIVVGERLRDIDEAWAQGLAAEFAERDMHNPVKLMLIEKVYHLCEGGHRFRAHQIMGRSDIAAKVYEPSTKFPTDELRLHEIDENLMRRELSTLDRAACIVERKRILKKLHGETRGGDRTKSKRPNMGLLVGGDEKEPNLGLFSINEEVAAKMGFSKSTLKALEAMYLGLSAATRKRVASTPLSNNRAQLVQLSKVAAEDQKGALDILLAKEPKATNVSAALALHLNKVDVKNPDEIAFARFVKLWGGASKKVKKQITSYIAKAGA